MNICSTCGAPDHMRCNCVTIPFCDQCDENDACNSEMDTACVIYHPTYPGQTPLPSNLIALALANGSSAQTIFDAIDAYLRNHVGQPVTPIDSPSIDLTAVGFTLRADAIISPDTNNQLSIHSNGLYAAPYINLFKVKTDVTGSPKYLEDALVGGTDGCVSITPVLGGGVLAFIPTLDIECLAGRICSADITIKEQIADCLLTAGLGVLDTNSIDLTLAVVGTQKVLSANSKISATPGNSIIINADGLFVPPSGGTITGANNGTSISGGNTVQLGGTLIQNTTIDHGASFQLNFINIPKISIGTSAALTSASLFVTDTSVISTAISAFSSNQERNLTNTSGFIGADSFLKIVGGPFTQTSTTFNTALGGQLWLSPSGDLSLNVSPNNIISGIYGTFIKSGANNITGNIICGGQFQGNAADGGNVTSMAAIRLGGLNAPPPLFGSLFTGTVTNYYGAYFEDISTSTYAANITNKYAIFQVGTTDLNVFSTAVTVSDVRKKENIINYTKGLAEIDRLRTVEYNFIADKSKQKKIGVIAQEVEAIIPEAVYTRPIEDLEDFRLVETNTIFYTMLNAIKDLSAQNKVLTDRIVALEIHS